MKYTLFFAAFLAFVSCKPCDPATCTKENCCKKTTKDSEHEKANEGKTIPLEGTTSAAYDCPMKCEGAKSDKPGTCPVCKMDLEKAK